MTGSVDVCQEHGLAYCKRKKKSRLSSLLSQVSLTFPPSALLASHTLKEQFPVGHWILTECPHTRYSGEDGYYRHLCIHFWAEAGGLSNSLFPLPRYSKIKSLQCVATTRYRCWCETAQSYISGEDARYHVPKTRVSEHLNRGHPVWQQIKQTLPTG